MLDLNDKQEILKKDSDGYFKILARTPGLTQEIWEDFTAQKVVPVKFKNICVCAMGGSAIGADLARFIVEKFSIYPMQIIRDYKLPNWVNKDTLLLAISYSGNTEETLSSFLNAKQRGAKIFVIASGGKLIELAKKYKKPFTLLPKDLPPRTAWSLAFFLVLELLTKYKAIRKNNWNPEQLIKTMKQVVVDSEATIPVKKNITKEIAIALADRVPVIFGAEHFAAVACRWKGEFNENSKIPSYFEVIPELNHNTQQGLECQQKLKNALGIIVLTSNLYHDRNFRRAEIIKETFTKMNFDVTLVQINGKTHAEAIAKAVMVGDYISVYLALLLGKNPVLFTAIEELKALLKTDEWVKNKLKI